MIESGPDRPLSDKERNLPSLVGIDGMNHRNKWIAAGLVLCCVAIYGQTLAHDFVNYDDQLYVTDNDTVQAGLSWANVVWAFTTDRAMYMHPLTWMSHMLDCQIYGMQPWGHHLTNLLLHALNAVLLFLALARMTRCALPSALVAALFAVHPLHVESVAWIAERKDMLSMLFWAAGLGTYVWYRERPNVPRYLAVALMFLLGFLSKPMMVTFPLVLLLLDYWPLGRVDRTASVGASAKGLARLAVEKTPLLLMTVVMCAITFVMQAQAKNLEFGAKVPLVDRCANAVVVYALYLVKTLWPFGLAVYYPHPISRPAWQIAGAAVMLAAVTLVCVLNLRRRPWLIVGWLWYLGTLVPVIEVVQAGTFSHADRYTYIPLIGIFIMAAFSLNELWEARYLPGKAAVLAGVLAITAFTAVAVHQTAYWKDSESLFRHALAVTADNTTSRNNLASILCEKKKTGEAFENAERAVELAPKNYVAIEGMAVILHSQGRYEEALAKHREALAIQPGDANAQRNLRKTLKELGQLDGIQSEYERLEQKASKSVEDYCRLGALAMNLGDPNASFTAYETALKMEPDGKRVYTAVGDMLSGEGKAADALAYYEKALHADPQDAQTLYNMGVMLSKLKRPDEAAAKYREALQWKPDFAQAHNNLGSLSANAQRLDEAVEHYRKAIALDPNYAQARVNLASLLAFQGQTDEAITLYDEAIRIKPEAVGVRLSLARLLLENRRGAEAETQLKKVLELEPNNGDALKLMQEAEVDKASTPPSEKKTP
jgi:tetratricopeptide (TPR) repeat protein